MAQLIIDKITEIYCIADDFCLVTDTVITRSWVQAKVDTHVEESSKRFMIKQLLLRPIPLPRTGGS